MFLADQYVQQDHFFPCAILRNVIAMKCDAKLYRETPRDSSDSWRNTTQRQVHEDACECCGWTAGISDGFGTTYRAVFLGPREDSPPSAKDKAPGEKQMPPAPYVPLAVASESA
jgi:hypothetical protein